MRRQEHPVRALRAAAAALGAVAALALPGEAGAAHAWQKSVTGATAELLAVWASGAGDVYAVAREGVVLHTTDGGSSWSAKQVVPVGSGGLHAIHGRDADAVYAAGGNRVVRTRDQGSTWTTVFTGGAGDRLRGVWAMGAGEVFVVGDGGVILRSTDGGTSWTQAASGTARNLDAVWAGGPEDVYAAGAGGVILHSRDHGNSWTAEDAGIGEQDVLALWGSGADNVYATTIDGAILRSDGRGLWSRAWRWDRPLSSIWGAGANDVWLVASSGGAVLHTVDGRKFVQVKTGVVNLLHGVWTAGGDDTWIVGEGGLMLHGAGNGKRLEKRSGVSSAGHEILVRGWASGPDDVYAVGYLTHAPGEKIARTAEIVHSSDGGASWTIVYRSTRSQSLHGIWGSAPTAVFAVGSDGALLRSRDRGRTWEAQRTPRITANLNAVWGAGPDEVWAVGDKGTILRTHDGGTTWSLERPAASLASLDLRRVHCASRDDVWLTGVDPKNHELVVVRSTDGGKSWKELHRSGNVPAASAVGFAATSNADVWVFSEYDSGQLNLFHSIDEGSTWTLVRAGHGLAHGIWSGGPGSLYLVTAGGDILRGTGGATFADDGSGTLEQLYGVFGTGGDDVYAVGEKGLILHAMPASAASTVASAPEQR